MTSNAEEVIKFLPKLKIIEINKDNLDEIKSIFKKRKCDLMTIERNLGEKPTNYYHKHLEIELHIYEGFYSSKTENHKLADVSEYSIYCTTPLNTAFAGDYLVFEHWYRGRYCNCLFFIRASELEDNYINIRRSNNE